MIAIFGEIMVCILLADFISGFGHWLEDTYGKPDTPLIGRYIVQPNIEHHHTPRSFLARSYWSRNSTTFFLVGFVFALVALFGTITWQLVFVLVLLSQVNEIHAYAHRKPTEIPQWIRALQETGLMQSRRQHGEHHQAPFKDRFCILTNFLNPILDTVGFWWSIEYILLKVFGLPTQRESVARTK